MLLTKKDQKPNQKICLASAAGFNIWLDLNFRKLANYEDAMFPERNFLKILSTAKIRAAEAKPNSPS